MNHDPCHTSHSRFLKKTTATLMPVYIDVSAQFNQRAAWRAMRRVSLATMISEHHGAFSFALFSQWAILRRLAGLGPVPKQRAFGEQALANDVCSRTWPRGSGQAGARRRAVPSTEHLLSAPERPTVMTVHDLAFKLYPLPPRLNRCFSIRPAVFSTRHRHHHRVRVEQARPERVYVCR